MDKNKIASALKFNPSKDAAPQVIAKGVGLVAENIIQVAKDSDIPVYVDPKLANSLRALEIGEMIPEDLYEIVAEVLVFIAQLDKGAKNK